MDEKYVPAMTISYANQKGGITIPADQLNGIVRIPLGFQPLGIASSNNQIAIAAYFEPAICLAKVNRDNRGLHFKVNWIRGVNHGITSVRLFPDMLIFGEANRAQTVNFSLNGALWVSRNADREFFILLPPIDSEASPNTPEGRWTLTDKLTLSAEFNEMVHSALLSKDKLLTTAEANFPFKEWYLCRYNAINGELKERKNILPWMYGIGEKSDDDGFYLISDFRHKQKLGSRRNGIYLNTELVVPDVYGNGICFLNDGSALVSRYGQASPGAFNGEPGQLVYVPKDLFIK